MQDNGTVAGGASTLSAWQYKSGGDGFQVVFDRNDPYTVYTESQNGYLYYLQSGSWAQDFTTGIDSYDRRSWDMPFINDKNNVFYTGTFRMYKNTTAPYGSWVPVSADLTDGGSGRSHIITALGVSEINPNFVYSGTGDGNVWRSTNAGSTWTEITNTLADIYVTSVEASPYYADYVYVGQSGYRDNSNIAHIHKSTDKGNTWTSIAGNMPNMSVNAIVIIPYHKDSILFVATDGGIYGTVDGGVQWDRVGNNMPIIPVFDLVFDSLKRRLVAGTYARGMYSIPIDSIIPNLIISINSSSNKNDLTIYPNPVKDYLFVESSSLQSAQIEIFNSSGKLVSKQDYSQARKYRVNLTGLKPGIYFTRIYMDQHYITKKILKL